MQSNVVAKMQNDKQRTIQIPMHIFHFNEDMPTYQPRSQISVS